MTRRRIHAFTLIEVVIASALTLVMVSIAMQFASNMSLEARRLEQQGDLAARTAIAHSFLATATDAIGYGWTVMRDFSGNPSGSFGEINCAVTSACTAAKTLPFQICAPGSVDHDTCDAHSAAASTADSLRFYAPRDGIIDGVRIIDRKTTVLPTSCSLSSPVTFTVTGLNANPWAANDLVLVSVAGHASIFSVDAAFAVGSDPAAVRDLVLNIGTPGNMKDDDGDTDNDCNAALSLKGASVFRLRLGAVRLNQAAATLEYGEVVRAGQTMAFTPVVTEVDDFQVRLDLQRMTVDTTNNVITAASLCSADTQAVLIDASGVPDCNAKRLNATLANGDLVRLAGLRLGVILRSRGGIEPQAAFRGLFDRTAVIGTDRRIRRTVFLYAGLPNALL